MSIEPEEYGMERLKLMIVDDEKIMLKGLLETYDWEKMGFEVIGSAMNGEDALTLIQQTPPDVVLTDICMKRMDGIQLMEETKKTNPEICFVVLSAYKDFEYAKEACRLGAISYLLKPVTDEMFDKMSEVYEICMNRKQKYTNYETWKKFLLEDETNFCSYMLERFLKGSITREELLSVGDAVEKHFEKNHYFAALCVDVDILYKITEPGEYNARRFALASCIKEELNSYPEFWSFVNPDGSRTYIVNMGEYSSNGKLKLILSDVKKKMGFEITAAVTNGYPGLDGLYQAYVQIQRLYELAEEEEVGLLEETAGLETAKNRTYPAEVENRILSGIRKCDKEQVKQGCIEFVEMLTEDEETNRIFLQQLAVRVQIMLNDSCGLQEEIRAGFYEYYQMAFRYPAVRLVHILYELFLLIVEKRLKMVPEGEEEKYVSYVRSTCLYMEENMKDEELSIVQAAERVFLNPVYLGRVFKSVKGMSFRQYLLQIRMEKAKQLLAGTAMTVTEICQEVGIPNASYFAKLFKQYTGQLPSEYKK